MKRIFLLFLFGILIVFLLAIGSYASETKGISIFVSILPQKYFLEKIGGDRLDIRVMVQPGTNPHTYEPKPKQMVALSQSRAYFAIGVHFEQVWLKKISDINPDMHIVRTDRGIQKIPMTTRHHGEHAGNDSKSPHASAKALDPSRYNPDPHIWTTPPLVKVMAKNILNALVEIDPMHGTEYAANYGRFIEEIDVIDQQLRSLFQNRQGLEFMVFHPAWGYFAKSYGLVQVPIEIEGKQPKPAQLNQLIQHAKSRGIKVVFVQPQLSTKCAQTIADELDGRIVFADPLAYDWAANLSRQADAFKAALR